MRKIYVADFGAGNTCMYSINPDSDVREPSDLIEPLGEPSGYAIGRNGSVILGTGLYGLGYNDDVGQFRINLKAQPTEANEKEMVFYFSEWLKKLKRERHMEFNGVDEAFWLIGCPTGKEWKSSQIRERYKKIFEKAGFENVYIIPESNAAMAYYQKRDRIKDSLSHNGQLLLIDQGAYSLDSTYYSNGEMHSFGSYLGAGLIDRMIVHMMLYEDEETFRKTKKMINMQEVKEKARNKFERDGIGSYFHTYLLLQARQLKERYFTALRQGTMRIDKDIMQDTDFEVEGDEFVLFTNADMMYAILEKRSVRDVLGEEFTTLPEEVQQELGDMSWMNSFRRYLDSLSREFRELRDGRDAVILLTGGGSQMNCISEAVKQHFPAAGIHHDFNAVSAIGKGMAVWGPDKIRAMDFEKKFNAFMEHEITDEDGNEITLVASKLSKAFLECSVNIARLLISEEVDAVSYGIGQWLSYNCDSTKIPENIERHLKDWVQESGLPEYKKDIMAHIDVLKEELNTEIYSVMDACKISRKPLLEADDNVFLSECSELMPKIFSAMVDDIAAYYKKHEIWTHFENRGKGIFSNPRQSFFNSISKTIDEWIDKETDSTIELCNKAFYEWEFDIESEGYTFSQRFVFEGYIDLFNLMKKRVKSILGELVLEEYIEDK